MKTLLINWPHKLLIFFFFGLTYAPVLYFGIMKHFTNMLLGDAARSLTFIWTVFLLTILNAIYRVILLYTKNDKFTKFLIRVNIEYGKIYTGLWLTAFIFIIQAALANMGKISVGWEQGKLSTAWVISLSLAAFLVFPTLAAIANYFMVKFFRQALWDPKVENKVSGTTP